MSLNRLEDQRLLTGKGRYADNTAPIGSLAVLFVRSPHAHARLVGIDKAEALAMPGVAAIYTAEDTAADGLGHLPAISEIKDAEGKRHREKTGQSLMVPRWDIVPIPEHLRGHLAQNSIHEFTAETAQSMYDFRADDVIGKATGRPILLLHSSVDSVTPTEQSIEMFKRASQPCDLHLFAETDHFMFSESNSRVRSVIYDWLEKYLPVAKRAAAA